MFMENPHKTWKSNVNVCVCVCVCVCVSVFPFYANFLLKFPGSYDIEGKKGKTVGERGVREVSH